MKTLLVLIVLAVCIIGVSLTVYWKKQPPPAPGTALDEAMIMGRTAESLPAAAEDYFHDMDRGVPLTTNEAKGRNTWIVWTGGNDRFWDYMASHSYGCSSVSILKKVNPPNRVRLP